MQDLACERVIPKIVCTRPSICDEDYENESNNNCEPKQQRTSLARQRKIARSRVRRNSRRLTLSASDCRRSSSSSRSPSPICRPSVKSRGSQTVNDEEQENKKNNLKNNSCAKEQTGSGYRQYLLEVPNFVGTVEWSEPSGDDLSSEWDSDQSVKGEKIEEVENRPVVSKV